MKKNIDEGSSLGGNLAESSLTSTASGHAVSEGLPLEKRIFEISEKIFAINAEIDQLGYEIQSISLNIGRINSLMKHGNDRKILQERRRKAIDAMNKRINELQEKKKLRRELVLKRRKLKALVKDGESFSS